MKQKIASIFAIVSLVFFHTAPVFAQLDTGSTGSPQAGTPTTDTTTAEETVTPPVDTTAPVISGVAVTSIGINEVTIVWSTDEAAVSTLEYGTTNAYGQSAALPATALLAHTATLTGLTAGTAYHYCVHATDVAGNKSSSCSHTFTTEAQTATETIATDSDSDGVPDTEEIGTGVTEESSPEASVTDPQPLPDTDSDGTPNYLDPDDDGDGIPTETENTSSTTTTGGTATSTPDTTTSPTTDETQPSPEATAGNAVVDTDADSVPDYLEPNTTDTDGDGITNNLDPDDDGDSVPTIDDGTVTNDPVEPVDTDGDGTPNYLDPNDDGDAIPTTDEETQPSSETSAGEAVTSTDPTAVDTDGDTVPDYLESNTTDTDSDGIPNVNDPDDDGDTVPTADEVITDTSDTDAAVDESLADTDSDGIPNALDSDDDGDGTPTAQEDTNNDGSVINDDTDNDGIPNFEEPNNVDSDQDGLTNNVDNDDDGDTVPTAQETVNIPAPASSGGGGGGGYYYIPPIDTDGDGIPDYLDTNDDGDAILTIKEDTNNDKILSNDDADKDGIADYLESNSRDLDKDGKKDAFDNEDDGDGILSRLDSDPYSQSCYAPAELGYAVYIVLPNGEKRMAGQYAKKIVIASDVIRYDFELGTDNDFNDLSVRVNDEGHRSFVATVMNSKVGVRYVIHLQILGNGQVEKDLILWSNSRSAVNVPKKIAINQYLEICGDHENFCPAHITQYMRKGANNDPVEVSKLQSFLVDQEGFTGVQVNGVFDTATDVAVRAFQEKHSGIILGPWAVKIGTGYVYRTTTKRINDLYCAAKK